MAHAMKTDSSEEKVTSHWYGDGRHARTTSRRYLHTIPLGYTSKNSLVCLSCLL